MRAPGIQTIYGLSPQQQGILFQTLTAEPGLFIEQTLIPFEGFLNLEALQRAWQHAIDRHDILRTAFVWKQQQEPMQVVLQTASLPIAEHDLRDVTGVEQERLIAALVKDERQRPFDLLKPPLMRVALIRTGEMSRLCVWTQHHILMDGWCGPTLLNEVAQFYQAFSTGQDPNAPPSPQYKEYIAWLKRQDSAAAERFWRSFLAGICRPTPLGTENPDLVPTPEPERWASIRECASHDFASRLATLARDHRLTLNTLLQGAWALLLSRYSQQEDVMFGVTVSGRPAEVSQVEQIIGLFINTVPCRARVRRNAPLSEWLSELQSAHAESRRFDYCATGQIHEWTDVPLTARLYESILVVENYPADMRQQQESAAEFVGARTSYLLTLVVQTVPDLRISAVFDSARIERAAVQSILQHLLFVLNMFATNSESMVGTVLDQIPARSSPVIRTERAASTGGAATAEDGPQTEVEQQLVTVCKELLRLTQIPVTANFFELGGHSLLLMRLASRIRQEFDVELPLRVYFEARSLRELAATIEEAVLRSIEELSDEEAQRLTAK
jgi:Non-ribosomal peptide synthetase modules and related proteins